MNLESIGLQNAIIFGVIALLLIIMVCTMIVVTGEKTSKILTVFGSFQRNTSPGLSFKAPWPFVEVSGIVDLNIMEIKGRVTVKSKDNVFLEIPLALQYHVVNSRVREAFYELDNPVAQMKSYLSNTLRGEATKLTMDELFMSNKEFEVAVDNMLTSKFDDYGFAIDNVLIDDPEPSEQLRESFDRVIASKREKEAAENEAEALKIKMIGEAKAEGESLKIKGDAFKDFRMKIAEGNKEAVDAFIKGDENLTSRDVLDFFAGVDLRDTIRDASKNKGTLFVIPADFGGSFVLPQIDEVKEITL